METIHEDETTLLEEDTPSVNTQPDSYKTGKLLGGPPLRSGPETRSAPKKAVRIYEPRSVTLPHGNRLYEVDERTRLLRKAASGVYTRRWYILVVFCFINIVGSLVFNTWGPITAPAKLSFGWSTGQIALLANWGCIGYLVAALPCSWLLDNKGKTLPYFRNSPGELILSFFGFCGGVIREGGFQGGGGGGVSFQSTGGRFHF